MPALLDEPITAEMTSDGRPAAITWRGSRYPVRVLFRWPDAHVYRVAVTLNGRPAIGEIVGSGDGHWRLRSWWTY